jgi:hypothetical protein
VKTSSATDIHHESDEVGVTHCFSTVKTTKFSGVTWLKFELYEIAKTVPAAMLSF